MRKRSPCVVVMLVSLAGCGGSSDSDAQAQRPMCSVELELTGDLSASFSREYPCPTTYVTGQDNGAISVHMPQDEMGLVTDAAALTAVFVSVRMFGLNTGVTGALPAGVMVQPRDGGIPQLWMAAWDSGKGCEAVIESATDVRFSEGLVQASVTCTEPLSYYGQQSTLKRLQFRAAYVKPVQ